jgi:hypothetical protein
MEAREQSYLSQAYMRECDVGTREWKERRSPGLLALLDCSLVVQYLFRSGDRRYEKV